MDLNIFFFYSDKINTKETICDLKACYSKIIILFDSLLFV